jgi:hypothetical protein
MAGAPGQYLLTNFPLDLRRKFFMRAKPKKQRRTRGPSKFRKSEVARAARGMIAAGLSVRGIEIDPVTGTLRVLVGQPETVERNSWDDVLDAENEKRPA